MMGRGKLSLLRHDPDPWVNIGISLSTSPSALSASSEEPFYVVVTARILTTPRPEKPIVLRTHLSPLHHLHTRAFEDIRCTTDEAKFIEIWPHGWPQYVWDKDDIPNPRGLVTIPPRDQEKGERYRVKLTDACLGTNWWTFGTVEDLKGVRLRTWQSRESEEAEAEGDRSLDQDPELKEEIEQERRDLYGDRYGWPTLMGENHSMLALVDEGPVEFEVV